MEAQAPDNLYAVSEEDAVILGRVRALMEVPEFIQSLTGGQTPLELAGRLIHRSGQVAEMLISIRERGAQENSQPMLAGGLAQVTIFLLALAERVGVDLLATTAAVVETEKKTHAEAQRGVTVPPPGNHGLPN